MSQYTASIQQLYVAYFGRPADAGGLAFWEGQVAAANGSTAAISAAFAASTEYTTAYAGKSPVEIVNQVYVNLFGHDADPSGLLFWANALQNKLITIDNVVTKIAAGAQDSDKVAFESKVAAATAFTNALDTTAEILGYNTAAIPAAKAFIASVTDEATMTSAIAGVDTTVTSVVASGVPVPQAQTIVLTKGLDNVVGGAGNDVIIGSISTAGTELNTYNTLDVINGGNGIDTLKLVDETGNALTISNLTKVEVVELSSTKAVNVNTVAVSDLTDLNVVKTGGAVAATAAASANVKVDVQQATAVAGDSTAATPVADVKADIAVNGGKNVVVNVTGVKQVLDVAADDLGELNAIKVGQQTAAKGTVVVNSTGVAAANSTNVTLSSISVTGGTSISVTQKASGDVSGLTATTGGAATHTEGAINITATADTTTVNVKQDATILAQSRTAFAGVDEVATVTFTKLDNGQSVTAGGLTFTANKDLTAAQVAAAFAGLTDDAVAPGAATGDTNGGSVKANGTFTGSLLPGWHTGAVNGNSVTFTGDGSMATLNVAGTGATVVTNTDGVDAQSAQNRLGVTAGVVTITGAAALASVTVDGYNTSTGSNGIVNGSGNNTALASISLSQGTSFDVDSAAATLALTLNKVNGTVDIQAGTKTLNAAVTSGATDTATLKSATAEAVNVSGTGTVAGSASAGNLAAATSINTSAMTAGSATFTIADGTKTTYTGGAGVDSVSITNADTAITKAVTLGAGDDTLTLSGAGNVVAPTATLSGGAGTDIIAMNGASAAALSASSAFADKIDGFEKLSITDQVTAARTVNMANMDGITYVISNNATASASSTGNPQVFSFDIAGLTFSGISNLLVGGVIAYTSAGAANNATILAGIPATLTINSVLYDVTKSGTVVTLTSHTNVAAQPAISLSTSGVAAATPITNAGIVTTAGVADVVGGSSFLTIDKIANNGTLELVGAGAGVVVKLADASGSSDSFNIVTKVVGSDLNFGTADVVGVETIRYTATDTVPTSGGVPSIQKATLNLKADKVATLTIDGNSHVSLTLDATTNKLATINASALTGNLTFAANGSIATTVTGGAGSDVLSASVGATAKADVLIGGAGSDTLTAGSNGATLTGGAGNDLFILTSGATTGGTKEGNTYSTVTDFSAGDVLKLEYYNAGTLYVTDFAKLTAVLNDSTATFSNFLDAAVTQANVGQAVYFSYKGDTYVVVDSDTQSTTFDNAHDLVIKLTGVNGDNLSWNSTYGTVALV